MRIEGKCHCGNIRYVLDWPGEGTDISIRACGCTFCTKHGGNWTSHRGAELAAEIHDAALLSKYRFGTQTADFYVCARCGAVLRLGDELIVRAALELRNRLQAPELDLHLGLALLRHARQSARRPFRPARSRPRAPGSVVSAAGARG